MRLIITHFYNEEFLLPWWLEHHKKYFDLGLCIDYNSTDRSVEIIHDICPHWQVITSQFKYFDSVHLEYEVMKWMRQVPNGHWIIALPTSEFLVGDILGLTAELTLERKEWIIPSLIFSAYDPQGKLDHNIPLWEQVKTGRHYKDLNWPKCWTGRNLHNFSDIFYYPGRHFENINTDRAMIFKFNNVLIGPEMIKRKLQIQDKISDFDKHPRAAITHLSIYDEKLTEDNLLHDQMQFIGEPYDCSDYINSVVKYI